MALQSQVENGVSRLVGDDTSEMIRLSSRQLANFPGGLWTLNGDDTVEGTADSEWIATNQGEDWIFGKAGDDTLMGGKENDQIEGEAGNDFLRGDLDVDIVRGGEGNDTLFGGKGSDQLFGESGNDALFGDRDSDTLHGGDGLDTLTGGEGSDVFVILSNQGLDLIADFEKGVDLIQLPEGLNFSQIRLQSSGNNQENTLILDSLTGQQLAQLNNIQANSLTSTDFLDQGLSSIEPSFDAKVVALTNEYRIQNGLPPLNVSLELTEAAETHSQNMALQDFFDHTGLDGSDPADRARVAGYSSSFVGENIGAGSTTPEEVVAGWISSEAHRNNLLNPNYTEIGVGYYFLENDTGRENWNYYWTQVFGSN